MSIDIYMSFQNVKFGLHNILGKLIFAILICNQKKPSIKRKYPSVLRAPPNVEDGSPIHCINFKSTKKNMHKSIKGLQVHSIVQVAFDCILFGKSFLTLPRCLVPS